MCRPSKARELMRVQGGSPVGCRGEAPEEINTLQVQGGSPGGDMGQSPCRVQGQSPWLVCKGNALAPTPEAFFS